MKRWRLHRRPPAWVDTRRRTCLRCGQPAKVFHPDRHYTAYCSEHGRHLVESDA